MLSVREWASCGLVVRRACFDSFFGIGDNETVTRSRFLA